MPGFGSGLAHSLAVGAEGYGEGDLENQQRLLALAAQRRAQALEQDKVNTSHIEALAKAAEAGLTVAPTPDARSGETTVDTGGSPTTPEAGPAANNAKPTRLGSISGMDISVPPNLESKAIRDKRAAITAGVELPPQPRAQSLHERVMELRNGGMPMDQAIKQARGEFGQDPDPRATYRADRDYAVTHPTRSSSDTPDSRARYVLRRASDLQKARKVGYRVQPGMDRESAEQTAGDEWDRVHGIDTQVTTPSAKTAPTPKGGDINLKPAADTLSTADQQMAAKDSKFAAWLVSKGKLKAP